MTVTFKTIRQMAKMFQLEMTDHSSAEMKCRFSYA